MATSHSQKIPPVLRVGWVVQGKLVQELLIEDGGSLFLDKNGLHAGEKQRWFAWKQRDQGQVLVKLERGHYHLQPGGERSGRIQVEGENRTLTAAAMPLPIGARGKVVLPEGTLLLQVLAAQAVPAAAWWREEEESVFHGMVGGFGMAAMAFVTWMQSLPPMEQELSVDEVLAYVDVANIPRVQTVPTEIKTFTPGKKTDPTPRTAAGGPTERGGPGAPTARPEDLVAGLQLGSLLNGGNDSLGPLMPDIDPIGAGGGPGGFRQGKDLDPDAPMVDIHLPKIGGPGGPKQGGLEVKIPSRVVADREEEETIQTDLGSDATKVLAVIRKYNSGVEACTSSALKEDPNLKARLSATWMIQEGRVGGAKLTGNGTADLQSCVLNVVRRMQFEKTISVDSVSYTWIVSGL
ncbi:MAG TPA: hypothetical protein PKW90_09190 [Myxococcota bacterium]|nr:hypothetical protein [Myxococcota bacterium]